MAAAGVKQVQKALRKAISYIKNQNMSTQQTPEPQKDLLDSNKLQLPNPLSRCDLITPEHEHLQESYAFTFMREKSLICTWSCYIHGDTIVTYTHIRS